MPAIIKGYARDYQRLCKGLSKVMQGIIKGYARGSGSVIQVSVICSRPTYIRNNVIYVAGDFSKLISSCFG